MSEKMRKVKEVKVGKFCVECGSATNARNHLCGDCSLRKVIVESDGRLALIVRKGVR